MSEVVIETAGGRIKGRADETTCEFLGVPFAAAPAGTLRWSAPGPCGPWSGVRDCFERGPQAWQAESPAASPLSSFMRDIGLVCSEDCLNLNVWAPLPDGRQRPVFVWVHGGGFVRGSGSQPLYDGRALAANGDILVVTINYRLGALGFLDLASATGGRIPATGNEGVLDVLAAVHWVRANIAAFGGDPDNITLAGESAGAFIIPAMLAMPDAEGLVRRIVLESGAASSVMSGDRKAEIAGRFLARLDIRGDQPERLFDCEPEKLIDAAAMLQRELGAAIFVPGFDGERLKEAPLDRFSAKGFPAEELLIGTTRDEWALYVSYDPNAPNWTRGDAVKLGVAEFPQLAWEPLYDAYEDVLKSAGRPSNPAAVYAEIQTDRLFKLPAVDLSDACAKAGVKVFHYLFEWESPQLKSACHTIELGALWRSPSFTAGQDAFFGSGPQAETIARDVQRYWTSFVHGEGVSENAWTTWTADNRQAFRIGGADASMATVSETQAIWRELDAESVLGRF